jgi:hypothetical protein
MGVASTRRVTLQETLPRAPASLTQAPPQGQLATVAVQLGLTVGVGVQGRVLPSPQAAGALPVPTAGALNPGGLLATVAVQPGLTAAAGVQDQVVPSPQTTGALSVPTPGALTPEEQDEVKARNASSVQKRTLKAYSPALDAWKGYVNQLGPESNFGSDYFMRGFLEETKIGRLNHFMAYMGRQGKTQDQIVKSISSLKTFFEVEHANVDCFADPRVQRSKKAGKPTAAEIRAKDAEVALKVHVPANIPMVAALRNTHLQGNAQVSAVELTRSMVYNAIAYAMNGGLRVGMYTNSTQVDPECPEGDHNIRACDVTVSFQGDNREFTAGAEVAAYCKEHPSWIARKAVFRHLTSKTGVPLRKVIMSRTVEEGEHLQDIVSFSAVSGATDDAPFFSRVAGEKTMRRLVLQPKAVSEALKKIALDLYQIPPEKMTTHELRRGANVIGRLLGVTKEERNTSIGWAKNSKCAETFYDCDLEVPEGILDNVNQSAEPRGCFAWLLPQDTRPPGISVEQCQGITGGQIALLLERGGSKKRSLAVASVASTTALESSASTREGTRSHSRVKR